MNKDRLTQTLASKRERLELYRAREAAILTGEVQSYGTGSKSASRYQTQLADLQKAIKSLEAEVAELEDALSGISPRRCVGVVPCDT